MSRGRERSTAAQNGITKTGIPRVREFWSDLQWCSEEASRISHPHHHLDEGQLAMSFGDRNAVNDLSQVHEEIAARGPLEVPRLMRHTLDSNRWRMTRTALVEAGRITGAVC